MIEDQTHLREIEALPKQRQSIVRKIFWTTRRTKNIFLSLRSRLLSESSSSRVHKGLTQRIGFNMTTIILGESRDRPGSAAIIGTMILRKTNFSRLTFLRSLWVARLTSILCRPNSGISNSGQLPTPANRAHHRLVPAQPLRCKILPSTSSSSSNNY